MKILMLTDFFKPMLGGIENHVYSLSKHLIKKGHEVLIVTVKQDNLKPFEQFDGVSVKRLNSLFQKIPLIYSDSKKKYHPPFQDFLLSKELKKVVDDFNPDIVHCHGWILFSYLPIKSKFNIPLLMTLHHYGLVCPKQDLFFKNEQICKTPFSSSCISCSKKSYSTITSLMINFFLRKNVKKLKLVDKFVAVSNFVRTKHEQYLGLSQSKLSTISNFYEIEELPNIESNNLPPQFILYIGQLVPYKGIDFLLRAYAASHVDLPLVLLGGKHQHHDYKRFDDGQKIIVKENVSRDLILTALKRCSFLVVPSIWADPCPTTVLEAMHFGKAVIGSNNGGIPEMVEHDKTGYIINPKNMQEFVAALRALSTDEKLQKVMGVAGKQRFNDYFDSGKIVQDIENIYDVVLKNGNRY